LEANSSGAQESIVKKHINKLKDNKKW
jgi:hypothetical protein